MAKIKRGRCSDNISTDRPFYLLSPPSKIIKPRFDYMHSKPLSPSDYTAPMIMDHYSIPLTLPTALSEINQGPTTTKKPSPKKPTKPLIINIAIWVGGTDTEWCAVKMNPNTPFKGVLKRLHQDHPRKQLKIAETKTFIFDIDTSEYLGLKDGASLDFFQEGDEPALMLDMTAT